MTTTALPVPLRIQLPHDSWEIVEPSSLGVHNVALLAVRRDLVEDAYTPTISVSGDWRTDGASLTDVAAESLAKIEAEAEEVELLDRHETPSDSAPVVSQVIGAVIHVDGVTHDLRQLQQIRGYVDLDDPGRLAVVIHTLTCTFAQFDEMGREFTDYLASIELNLPQDGAAG